MYDCSGPFFIVFLLFVSSTSATFHAEEYSKSLVLAPLDYTVYWRPDFDSNLIYLALKVKTTGWVAFGISEITSGSMPGADIMEGQVINGVGTITDRWSSAFATPEVDGCQDWVLVSAEETDGYTILEVKRPINTTDPQDRSIVSGTNMVIAAHGANGADEFGYHFTTRTATEIIFFGQPVFDTTPPSDEKTIALKMGNYEVPNKLTTYACQAFAVPIDQEYHIIEIEPVINASNVAHLHHFLVHNCYGEVPTNFEPRECHDMNYGMDCTGVISAWAAGGGSTFTPPQAGFRMGPHSKSIKFILLEVHYNNPTGQGGYVDNSGITLHYTPTLRQYDAAVVMIGDAYIEFPSIPPNTAYAHYESECLSNCTQTMSTEVTVFSSFPHMHQVGSQIWVSQWRDGVQIAERGRIEFWSFDHQTTQAVNFTIKPGDHLNLHCVYNTVGHANATEFGLASNQEMCLAFFSYYPRVYTAEGDGFSVCGSYQSNMSVCGAQTILFGPNPLNVDPPGGGNKTFGVASCKPATAPFFSRKLIVIIAGATGGAVVLLVVAIVAYKKLKKPSEEHRYKHLISHVDD